MKKLALAAILSAALLTGCASTPSATPTATVTATVTTTASPTATSTPTPTPTAVKTSGNYGADLAAAGVVPDNVKDYGDYMAKYFCQSSLTQASAVGSFHYSVDRFGKPGGESSGTGPAVVRLTVAYYCPERATAAEKELKALGYVK